MRAIMVSVDYQDLLQISLPWNRHHFEEIWVVTAPGKPDAEVAERHGAKVFVTDAFWQDGALFRKWLALELGLDAMGRHGWLCLLDADVLWPRDVGMREQHGTIKWHPTDGVGPTIYQDQGMLCSPLRRMCPLHGDVWLNREMPFKVPPEERWKVWPIHRNVNEWAGYTQIFHADDPALGKLPWHDTSWTHCGGADSFFQQKWPRERKVRPPWEVLHLGEDGKNWCGRATTMLDGTVPAEAGERQRQMEEVWRGRRGKTGDARFRHEKLGSG